MVAVLGLTRLLAPDKAHAPARPRCILAPSGWSSHFLQYPRQREHLKQACWLAKPRFRVSSHNPSPEVPMSRRLLITASMLLLSVCAASAQAPSPEALTVARTLVTTMKLPDQYKALLPGILLGLRRELTQDRPEIERDYDSMKPTIEAAFTPYYTAMLNDVATVYANSFTTAEMKDMESFFQRPAGQKYLEKASAVTQQVNQVT